MLEIVSANKAAYITIDQNDDVNATHEKIITLKSSNMRK
jgi:hypothetical protein